MRSPLALAVALALFAVRAAAEENCPTKSAAPGLLSAQCATADMKKACQIYVSTVLIACGSAAVDAANVLAQLKMKPVALTAQEAARAAKAQSDYKEFMFRQEEFEKTATEMTHSGKTGTLEQALDDYKPKYPGANPEAIFLVFLTESIKAHDALTTANETQPETTTESDTGPGDPKPDDSPTVAGGGALNLGALLAGAAVTAEKNIPPDPVSAAKVRANAGGLYLAGGDSKNATRLGRDLVKFSPSDPAGPSLLARAALKEDHPEEAAQWARKALALDPKNKEARNALAFAEASLSKSRLKGPGAKPGFDVPAADGDAAGGGGVFAKRMGTTTAGVPGGVVSPVAPEEILPVPPHLQLAQRTAAAGDLAGALGYLTLALDQNPDDDTARIMRAEISLALNNPDAALADADRLIAKHPDDPRALRAKASALLQLGRLEEALTTIERAVALAPLNAAGHLTRAMILEKLGRAADAVTEYREAARLDPALKPVAAEALRRLGFAPDGAQLSPLRGRLVRGAMVALSGALLLAVLLGASKRRVGAAVTTRPPTRGTSTRTIGTGDLVGGQYRVARELGRGGMGVVYEAIDETLKRSVALKQMHADLMTAEDAARFLQEARLVAQLKHSNIAAILSAVEDGGLFLVFELIDGRPLDKVLAQGGTMSPVDVRRVVGDLCEALACAHENRIIHRDLKPSNVMYSAGKRSKIMDFGIAHQARGAAETRTSASGTPPYMAPEQAMGSVLPASDLYALGVMTYELLAGVRPFPGPDFLGPKMRAEYEPISRRRPTLPPSLDAFFASALSADPRGRPQDATAFRKAFDACWDGDLARTVV